MRFYLTAILTTFLLASCVSQPEGITPVNSFELDRYVGKWYEIARLDHSFEEGLTHVTAHYSLDEDGNVNVINRGYDAQKSEWSEAEGTAKFVDSPDVGFLKVSFFGPFYGSYIVFELDENYQYAFVAGPNTDYLWLLSRQPTVPDALIQKFESQAKTLGFPIDQLIYVDHSERP